MNSADLNKGANLPDADHVARLIRFQALRREGDTVVGVFPQAFQLRDGEEYLSVTWIEYFGEYDFSSRKAATEAIQEDSVKKKLGKARLAVGVVADVKAAGAVYDQRLRLTYEPRKANKGHSAIRRLNDDNLELLELLAAETFSELFSCADLLAPADSVTSPQ